MRGHKSPRTGSPPFGGFELREAGLVIRPWRPDDAEQVFWACQDPEILRWTSLPRPYRREHAEGYVTEVTQTAWQHGTAAPMGVFDPSGKLLGSVGLISLVRGQTAEIGYWVAAEARGRGVATNGARAVARWALNDLGVQRLAWRAAVGNHASRLVAETIGFRVEGVLRKGARRPDGGPVDCWGASLLPGDLREADRPVDPIKRRRALTFGQPQPRLAARTGLGTGFSLRPFQPSDLAGVVAACQDPESLRWTTVPDPYRPEDADYFIRQYAPGCWARGESALFAMADDNDRYLGSIDLRVRSATDTADVGYLVAPWGRGRGFATAALRTLALWGVANLAVNRIEWRAYLGNDASRRVAEKAGFTIEGIARAGCLHRGGYRDAWTGAILAADLVSSSHS